MLNPLLVNNNVSSTEEIAYRLVVLEQQSYSGGNTPFPNKTEAKLIWNLFLKNRYNGNFIAFDKAESTLLIEMVNFRGLLVPRFASVIEDVMGLNFYQQVIPGWQIKNDAFEHYVIELADSIYHLLKDAEKINLVMLIEWMLASANVGLPNGEFFLPKLAIVKHASSLELKNQFNLTNKKMYFAFLGWFYRWCLPEYAFTHIPNWFQEVISSPSSNIVNSDKDGISHLLEAFYYLFHAETKKFDLNLKMGRLAYLGWFCANMSVLVPHYRHPAWLLTLIDSPSPNIENSDKVGVSLLVEAIWYSVKSLQEWLDIFTKDGGKDVARWFLIEKCNELINYSPPQWMINVFSNDESFLNMFSTQAHISREKKVRIASSVLAADNPPFQEMKNIIYSDSLQGGVNLVGWPRTEIGIGEDVRVGAESLLQVNIPFSIIDAALRLPPKPIQQNLGYDKYLKDHPVYDTDIVFLDASTQYRYYCFDQLKNISIKRKIIGVFPWELPLWSSKLNFVFEHVDTFWAATKYIYNAFSPYFERNKIMLAPPAVLVPDKELDDFNISRVDAPLTFLTTFDGLSSIHRKNPFATVESFKKAFPTCKDVRLIVKTMNFDIDNHELKILMREIDSDPRIELVNKALRRDELFALVRRSHCFVSLHRSEGFGRNIAEAMYFNRPVITSAYSGNLDFCFMNNSFLVEGKEIPVEPHQYAYSQGQAWFDASKEHASALMQEVYNNRARAAVVAKAGADYIKNFHSTEATGLRYKKLLAI